MLSLDFKSCKSYLPAPQRFEEPVRLTRERRREDGVLARKQRTEFSEQISGVIYPMAICANRIPHSMARFSSLPYDLAACCSPAYIPSVHRREFAWCNRPPVVQGSGPGKSRRDPEGSYR